MNEKRDPPRGFVRFEALQVAVNAVNAYVEIFKLLGNDLDREGLNQTKLFSIETQAAIIEAGERTKRLEKLYLAIIRNSTSPRGYDS